MLFFIQYIFNDLDPGSIYNYVLNNPAPSCESLPILLPLLSFEELSVVMWSESRFPSNQEKYKDTNIEDKQMLLIRPNWLHN